MVFIQSEAQAYLVKQKQKKQTGLPAGVKPHVFQMLYHRAIGDLWEL